MTEPKPSQAYTAERQLTDDQAHELARLIAFVKSVGYGRVFIVINKGQVEYMGPEYTIDVRGGNDK